MWWNDKKILFYERASSFSPFHRTLSTIIEEHIKKSDSIVEFGSGLGHIGETLFLDGYNAECVEIEEKANECARKRSGLNIFKTMDYKDYKTKRDVALLVFFGNITSPLFLENIFQISNKVIYVQNLHSGQSECVHSMHKNKRENTISFLGKNNYTFTEKEYVIPFPQPLTSKKEAKDFIFLMYRENRDEYIKFVKKTGNIKFPYLFTNNKHLSLYVIEKLAISQESQEVSPL